VHRLPALAHARRRDYRGLRRSTFYRALREDVTCDENDDDDDDDDGDGDGDDDENGNGVKIALWLEATAKLSNRRSSRPSHFH